MDKFCCKKEKISLYEELRNSSITIGGLSCLNEDGFMGDSIQYNKGKAIFEKLSEFYNIGRLKGATDPKMKVILHSNVLEALTKVVSKKVLDYQYDFFLNDNMWEGANCGQFGFMEASYFVYIESKSDVKTYLINGFFRINYLD